MEPMDEQKRGDAWRSLGDCLVSYLATTRSGDAAQSGEVVWNGGFSGPVVSEPPQGVVVPCKSDARFSSPQICQDTPVSESAVTDSALLEPGRLGIEFGRPVKAVAVEQGDLVFHTAEANRTDRTVQRYFNRSAVLAISFRVKSMDMKQILERISLCRDSVGISERALSLAAGMSADAIRNWRRKVDKGDEPGANTRSIEMVANALGVSREWLLTGLEDGEITRPDPQSTVARPQIFDNLRHVSVFDIDASAGDGAFLTDDEPIYEIGFPRELLGSLTQARNEEVAVIRVRGDSMLPTLMDGDQMLVDFTQRNTNRDGMFILRYDDVLRVKRIDINPTNRRLRVKSDNPVYDTFEVNPADLDVVGRVVWIGRRV